MCGEAGLQTTAPANLAARAEADGIIPVAGFCVNVASGPGCVTVSVNMLQCNEPFQIEICGKIKSEAGCIRNQVYSCSWNERADRCEYVK